MKNIIILPSDIYNLIGEYSNIKIIQKYIKTKQELRIKSIKYKCEVCKRKKLSYRQMIIIHNDYIVDRCKNTDRCCKNDLDQIQYYLDDYLILNKSVHLFGVNYKNIMKKKKSIRQIKYLFIQIRYSYTIYDEYHSGYVINSLYCSKYFFNNRENIDTKKLVKLSKLVNHIRRIKGNERYTQLNRRI